MLKLFRRKSDMTAALEHIRKLRIPAKATSRSDAWRPPIPVDGDQVARGA
jgi:hypothetical protein